MSQAKSDLQGSFYHTEMKLNMEKKDSFLEGKKWTNMNVLNWKQEVHFGGNSVKILWVYTTESSEDGEGSESKVFRRTWGGMNVKQRRRGVKHDSLVFIQEVVEGTIQSNKNYREHSAEFGTLWAEVPVRHPRRATLTGSAGLKGRGLGHRVRSES